MSRLWVVVRKELGILYAAFKRWRNDDGALMSAAVAFYVGLSFYPLMLLLISGFSLILAATESGRNAQDQFMQVLSEHLSPALEQDVREIISGLKRRSPMTGPIGFVGVVIASIAGFTQFDRAFDRIWNSAPPQSSGVLFKIRRFLRRRGIAFLMLFATGLVIVVIFLLGLLLEAIREFAGDAVPMAQEISGAAESVTTVLLNTSTFTLLYRWLPKCRVDWPQAIRGAAFVALGWEFGRQVLSGYIIGSRYSSAYGLIGSFIAIQLWCYYAVALIFLGAEYIQELRQRKIDLSKPASQDKTG